MLRYLMLLSVVLVFGLSALTVSGADDSAKAADKAADDSAKVVESVAGDSTDGYLPKPDEFVAVEEVPVMIHQTAPEYPISAKQEAVTGIVWIKVLVDKKGDVIDALIHKSSGDNRLDDAALKVAPKNKYKPAVKDGKPVAAWVTYKVEFRLDQ